jgi:uroporphyrinogen-III decarboxylase
VIYHFEATDIFHAKNVMRDRCCIRGNVPMSLLTVGTPEEVKAYCKKLIDVAQWTAVYMDAALSVGCGPQNVQRSFKGIEVSS